MFAVLRGGSEVLWDPGRPVVLYLTGHEVDRDSLCLFHWWCLNSNNTCVTRHPATKLGQNTGQVTIWRFWCIQQLTWVSSFRMLTHMCPRLLLVENFTLMTVITAQGVYNTFLWININIKSSPLFSNFLSLCICLEVDTKHQIAISMILSYRRVFSVHIRQN